MNSSPLHGTAFFDHGDPMRRRMIALFLFMLLTGTSPLATTAEDVVVVHPTPSNLTFNNPLKGWCPYPDAIHQPCSMVFMYAPWKSLEPNRGDYRFDEWEADPKHGWAHPAASQKRIVFRIVIDYPGRQEKRFGLPDWLKKDGVKEFPFSTYGGGFSPDYGDDKFIDAVVRLIRAVGQRYNRNDRIAFVQLGVLGHWGEWHVAPELMNAGHGIAEKARVRVIDAFRESFPDKQLMCRNAYRHAGKQQWLGFHDDLFPTDTLCEEGGWCFLKNLRDNGRQENWKVAPFGGEMDPGKAYLFLGDSQFARTVSTAKKAHFSWMGPYCPASEYATSEAFQGRVEELSRLMGYRFQLQQIQHPKQIQAGQDFHLKIRGRNLGVAPFYYAWPLGVTLIDPDGHQAFSRVLDVDIRNWAANSKFEVAESFVVEKLTPSDPSKTYPAGTEFRVAIGVIDPWKGMPNIRFANELPIFFGWTVVSRVKLAP